MPKLAYRIPPSSLMLELREVALDARALNEALKQANLLPELFPVEVLSELLSGLQNLQLGTAEGCREPLEYARSRLPALRRQFIKSEASQSSANVDQDKAPPLTRGMMIDRQLGALVNSVTTALDEYRALASLRDEEETDVAASVEIDTRLPDVASATSAARGAEQKLSNHIEDLHKITEPTSENAESLSRQMHDARALVGQGRVELNMPSFVPRWLSKTMDILADYPDLLSKTANTIQVGVDVARPLADAWSHFTHGFKHLVLDSVENAARDLKSVAERWKFERKTLRVGQKVSSTDLAPNDFSLEQVRTMIIQGRPPNPEWRLACPHSVAQVRS